MPNQATQNNDDIMNVGGNAGARLKSFVERIERIQEEIDVAKEDQKEIYAEVKSVGFDSGYLRKVIARRKKDREKVIEEDEMIKIYEDALEQQFDDMME